MKPETALQKAFREGSQAFITDPIDPETGQYTNTSYNPYKTKSIYYKEWERGFNTEYFKNQRG